jgi:hypothetical protein
MIRAPIGEYQTSNQSGPDRPPMRGLVVQSEPERVHCRWDLFWLDTVYIVLYHRKQGQGATLVFLVTRHTPAD